MRWMLEVNEHIRGWYQALSSACMDPFKVSGKNCENSLRGRRAAMGKIRYSRRKLLHHDPGAASIPAASH